MSTYVRWLFGIAAAFNVLIGFVFLFLRPIFLARAGFDPVTGSNVIIANLVGMFIVLFGWCYLLVAIDPVKNRPLIAVGAIGKLLAIVSVFVPWLTGAIHTKPPALLAGDLVFALLFLDYLRRTAKPEA